MPPGSNLSPDYFLPGRFHSGLPTCFASVRVRPPAGTSLKIVAPAPMVAP